MNPQESPKVSIEHMTRTEVDIAIEWARSEGWNPGVHDAECFYQADPKGFYAAKLDDEIVGTVSLVKYKGDFAFEGLYIVKPEFRGQGIGKQIQDYAMEKCREVNLGLDGVVAMQKKYEQYGFRFAHNNIRYVGTAKGQLSGRCQPIQRGDFREIAAFDSECFTRDRSKFLDCWLFQKDAASMLSRNQETDEISGYGVIRRCMQGHKIGPLFANDSATAELLLDSLTSKVPNETVFLDVPQPHVAAVELAQKRGMQPVFSTVRMYTKTAHSLPLDRIFGVTTFELG